VLFCYGRTEFNFFYTQRAMNIPCEMAYLLAHRAARDRRRSQRPSTALNWTLNYYELRPTRLLSQFARDAAHLAETALRVLYALGNFPYMANFCSRE